VIFCSAEGEGEDGKQWFAECYVQNQPAWVASLAWAESSAQNDSIPEDEHLIVGCVNGSVSLLKIPLLSQKGRVVAEELTKYSRQYGRYITRNVVRYRLTDLSAFFQSSYLKESNFISA